MEFLLEALLESLRLLPFFILVYFVIETIEIISANSLKKPNFLIGHWSTVLGAGFGLVPLCGFSVVATDLYADKKIKMGTLLAVYIATSDEAIPLLILSPEKISSILPLLLIKFFVAILVGLIVDLIVSRIQKKTLQVINLNATNSSQIIETLEEKKLDTEDHEHESHNHDQLSHQEPESEPQKNNESHHHGCCGHDIDTDQKKFNVKDFILHPLIHSLKIFAFVLIANIILGGLMEWIGQDKLQSFLASGYWFTPLLSCLVGLIPNCASSFAITTLFIDGVISFGACVGGLIVNAGIALLVLFKENKNIKQNLTILSILFSTGILVGYIVQLIGL